MSPAFDGGGAAGAPDRCPNCQGSLRAGIRFCTLCGAELGNATPGAGAMLLELPPARMMVMQESEEVEEFPLHTPVVSIGRDPSNDIVLSTSRASLRHARIIYRAGLFHLEDLGSVNGTQLDGEPLRHPRALRNGSIVRIGTSILKFQAGPEYR